MTKYNIFDGELVRFAASCKKMLLAQRRKLLILFIGSSMNHNFISVVCALLHDAVFLCSKLLLKRSSYR